MTVEEPPLVLCDSPSVGISGIQGLPASLHPELGLWKARGLPSLTASAPQVQGEKQTLRWQEGLEQRFQH